MMEAMGRQAMVGRRRRGLGGRQKKMSGGRGSPKLRLLVRTRPRPNIREISDGFHSIVLVMSQHPTVRTECRVRGRAAISVQPYYLHSISW